MSRPSPIPSGWKLTAMAVAAIAGAASTDVRAGELTRCGGVFIQTRQDPVQAPDPYRWLELDTPARARWIVAQRDAAQRDLARNPYRDFWDRYLRKIWDVALPFEKAETPGYKLTLVSRGLAKPTEVVLQIGKGEPRTLLSTARFAKNGTRAFTDVSTSPDAQYATVTIAARGSLDVYAIVTLDLRDPKNPPTEPVLDTIEGAAQETIYWLSAGEFVYFRRLSPGWPQAFRHRVGRPQREDTVFAVDAYGAGLTASPDKKLLMYNAGGGKKLLTNVITGRSESVTMPAAQPLGYDAERIFFQADGDQGNGRIVVAGRDQVVRVLVPETDLVLRGAQLSAGRLLLRYESGTRRRLVALDLQGVKLCELDIPPYAVVNGWKFTADGKQLKITYSSPARAKVEVTYDPATGQYLGGDPAEALLRLPDGRRLAVEYIEVQSRDGTRVPVRLSYVEGLARDGTHPSMIEGYGGFDVLGRFYPDYSPTNLQFMLDGGVYVAPALRGGSELGEAWHAAGKGLQKQHVFDDFIATAEQVQAAGYTSPARTAIMGQSNGGLLISAAVTQRPDLFRVAIPMAGVNDMVRREVLDPNFSAGWAYEHGTMQDADTAVYDQNLSPVHNAKAAAYPTVLVMVGEDDSRVNPAHSYKFAATLQAAQQGPNPIYLLPTPNSGHWFNSQTLQGRIAWRRVSDLWATVYRELGITPTAAAPSNGT